LPAIEAGGFGAVYLEAWLLGRPVVGVDIPAVRDVINDGVDGYVSPPEPAALAARILSLLDDPARADRMGAVGRAKAGRYGWPEIAARIEAVYQRLVAPGSSGAPPPPPARGLVLP
jgi:glycosyltransferase involved in cell wall biosynthesis